MRISDWSSDVCSSDLEVELRMARAAGGEEALVGGIGFLEAGAEGGIDLVAGARYARADRGGDPRAIGAAALPRATHHLGTAADLALPPGHSPPHHATPRLPTEARSRGTERYPTL